MSRESSSGNLSDAAASILRAAGHPSAYDPDALAELAADGIDSGLSANAEEALAIDPEVLRECAALNQSDTDNGRRLLLHFPGELQVMVQPGGRDPAWTGWTGTHWDMETGAHRAHRLSQLMGPRIALEVLHMEPSEDQRAALDRLRELQKKLKSGGLTSAEREEMSDCEKVAKIFHSRLASRRKFAVTCGNAGRISGMLSCLAPHVLREPDDFNADPLRLATRGHTLAFERKVEQVANPAHADPDNSSEDVPATIPRSRARLRAHAGHRREDMITHILPVDHDPKAKCPKWMAFLEEFQPREKVPGQLEFLQIASGLGLLGITVQRLFFHYGSGANGKSVFMEVLVRVLGDLATSLPAESFFGEQRKAGGAQADLARLYGKRFLRVQELPEDETLREDLIKRLTGGEAISVRGLYQGYFDFRPVFTGHMSGNGYPRISGTDNGIWRRMAVVHWPVSIPEERQRDFEEVVGELMEEAPGILNWLVEGARRFLEEGLQLPECVRERTAEYRETMDPLSGFVTDCLSVTGLPEDQVGARELYTLYQNWCFDTARKPMTEKGFGMAILKKASAHGFEKKKAAFGQVWRGVRIIHRPQGAPSRDGGSMEDHLS